MKFNLVYGLSGSGKSKTIYEDLKNKIGTESIYLIVPEQSNLTAEQNLFKITGANTLLNTEVLTLSRMASRVMQEVGGNLYTNLSKTGKSMLIYDILSKEKKNLKFLGKSEKNVDIVNNMLTELKKHDIDLKKVLDTDFNDKYMELKLEDIDCIYQAYEKKISEKFIDENDSMNILKENLKHTDMFKGSYIYIDDFLGFTAQEYAVFEELLKVCKEITVTVCADDLEKITKPENDIFYFNKKFARKLLEIAKAQNAEINKIHLAEVHRFKNKELAKLEKVLSGNNKETYNDNIENIELFLANNSYTEMEYIAKRITKLVKEENFRYNEIGIVTKNIDSYIEDAKAVFNKYEIPLFIDSKKELNQNILIKYIIALLDVYSKNWSYDAMFDYLKIGLHEFNNNDIYELENYCKKWGIKGSKWHREFSYEPINELQAKMEKLRIEITKPLLKFKQEISENRTVFEITKKLYNYLIENKINEILDRKIKSLNKQEITDEYNTSYKVLINVLDELVLLFGDEKITFDKYKELLQIGIMNSELGILPATQDQVILGDIERSRSRKTRALFIIGLNDGVFPASSREEGFLNDSDREKLSEKGFEMAKSSTELLYEEQFNIYRTFTIPENKLILSYSSTDKEGKALRASSLIKKIKIAFPNLIQKSDIVTSDFEITNEKATFEEALKVYKEFLDGNEISEEWQEIIIYFYNTRKEEFLNAISGFCYNNLPEKISDENISKLYGNKLKTSISRLESYRKCPFSFHLTYGLKLKENAELKMEAVDTGSFMHEVIDEFFRTLDENRISISAISDEEVEKIVSKIIEELLGMSKYYIFSSTAKFRLLTRRLKKVVLKSVEYIVYSIRNSDFEVLGHEIEFNNLSEFKPIQMSLFDDKSLEITGKIDRVDLGKIGDKQYVRVIDYKSSSKKIDLVQVEAGLQIQLITYLDALTESKDYEASGILYLGLIDNICKAKKNMEAEEIERKIRDEFRMKGFVLADVHVIKAMDKTLENSKKSDIIPVQLNKDGEIMNKNSNTLSSEEFKELQKNVKQVIKQISTEIMKGNIDIKPYNYKQQTGCDYCAYKTICNFNTGLKNNEYDYI
jgi:ATP-dependent helicase/nuclease subunit B